MQIRNQNEKIQLIRTKYDPAIKRGRSIILGTLSIYAYEIPAAINEENLSALADETRVEFSKLLASMVKADVGRTHSKKRIIFTQMPQTKRC